MSTAASAANWYDMLLSDMSKKSETPTLPLSASSAFSATDFAAITANINASNTTTIVSKIDVPGLFGGAQATPLSVNTKGKVAAEKKPPRKRGGVRKKVLEEEKGIVDSPIETSAVSIEHLASADMPTAVETLCSDASIYKYFGAASVLAEASTALKKTTKAGRKKRSTLAAAAGAVIAAAAASSFASVANTTLAPVTPVRRGSTYSVCSSVNSEIGSSGRRKGMSKSSKAAAATAAAEALRAAKIASGECGC
jgi:hypothetical protein